MTNFALKQCIQVIEIIKLNGRIEFDKKLIIESNYEMGFLAHFRINLDFEVNLEKVNFLEVNLKSRSISKCSS